MLHLHLEMIQRLDQLGLRGLRVLELVPEVRDLRAGFGIEEVADPSHRSALAFSLRILTGTGLEHGDVTGFGLHQIVHQDHLEGPFGVDGVLEVPVDEHRQERHVPRVLRDALATTVRHPAVPQLELQALGQAGEA